MLENAHRTVLREVLYRHHPWFGRRVCIHSAADKGGFAVFRGQRCAATEAALEPEQAVVALPWRIDVS